MTNYRAYKSTAITSAESPYYLIDDAPKHWGIFVSSSSQGTLTLEGGGTIPLNVLAGKEVFPCYASVVNVTTGSVYVLQ